MEKDVVCGMQVDPAKAAGSSQDNGKTYYFCSKGCQGEIRRESSPIREVSRPGVATPNTVWPGDRRTGAHGV